MGLIQELAQNILKSIAKAEDSLIAELLQKAKGSKFDLNSQADIDRVTVDEYQDRKIYFFDSRPLVEIHNPVVDHNEIARFQQPQMVTATLKYRVLWTEQKPDLKPI